jgi:hypothetical protein
MYPFDFSNKPGSLMVLAFQVIVHRENLYPVFEHDFAGFKILQCPPNWSDTFHKRHGNLIIYSKQAKFIEIKCRASLWPWLVSLRLAPIKNKNKLPSSTFGASEGIR